MYLILLSTLCFILSFFYFFLFEFFKKGWKKLSDSSLPLGREKVKFSIIVPARNEELHIENCLLSIISQNYPSNNFEVIIADDDSQDNTSRIVESLLVKYPQVDLRLIKMQDIALLTKLQAHKKAAIAYCIQESKYDWIITSDADTSRETDWLNCLSGFILHNQPYLVSMPVRMKEQSSLLENLQALEFMGLIGIGAASMANKAPNMCNGANLAYRKDIFYQCNGFEGIDDIASGDDELLMHKIHNLFPEKVMFLRNKQVMVSTYPENTWKAFLNQRKRWVSKSAKYSKKTITLILTLAWFYNLTLLMILAFSLINPIFLALFLIFVCIKFIIEWNFFILLFNFFKHSSLRRYFILGSLLHIPYVVFIGIYGNFGKYNWKGRKVK